MWVRASYLLGGGTEEIACAASACITYCRTYVCESDGGREGAGSGGECWSLYPVPVGCARL